MDKRKHRIGIYGGTFDPIHFGHLNLAFELMEKQSLNEVWFVPAQINPHKMESSPVSADHRLAMLQLALEGIPQFHINQIECKRPAPSYTVETLRCILQEPGAENKDFFLLLGEDSIPGFCRWHEVHEIIERIPLLIGSRDGNWACEDSNTDPRILHAIEKGMVKTKLMDISSTELRRRLNQNLYCGHLVPAKALAYLHEHRLYT